MKIIFDHQIFSIQKYGGVSRYFCEIASRLNTNHNHKVEICAPIHKNLYLSETDKLIHNGTYVKSFPLSSSLFSLINTHTLNYNIQQYNDTDIFHETYYNYPVKKPTNAKVVTTVHDMIHEIFPNEFGNSNKIIANKKKSIENSDHIICVSQNTKNDLLNIYRIPEEKISVIYLGNSFNSNQSYQQKNDVDSPFILYVGRRSGYKNFISLAKAIAISKFICGNFSLVCFGGGPFSREEILKLKSLGFPLDNLIHVEGDDSTLAWHYKHASLFVFPSHYEGFGIPLLEAMAFGCPIAASNLGSIPEIAGNAAAFFDPTNVENIRDCIESILSNPSLSRDLVSKGYNRLEAYSWDKCAEATNTAYKQIT